MSAISPRFSAQLEHCNPRKVDYFRHEVRYACWVSGQMPDADLCHLCHEEPAFDAFVTGADQLKGLGEIRSPVFFFRLGHIYFSRNPDSRSSAVQKFPINDHDDYLDLMAEELLANSHPLNQVRLTYISTSIAHLIVARAQYRNWFEAGGMDAHQA